MRHDPPEDAVGRESGDGQRACGDVLAALEEVERLSLEGPEDAAIDAARRALELLDQPAAVEGISSDPSAVCEALRADWARANSSRARGNLIRWRLHALLAGLTGDLVHRYEAVLARPDVPETRQALASALSQAGRAREARSHFDFVALSNPPTTPARVSLCMIVKNEEANLPACLASVADLVDEVVVVDTGSSDATREVAATVTARVFEFPWVDDFAAARNESLRHATGDWIFWLDADDRLDEESRHKLRALFAGLKNENVAYVMKCLCASDTPGGADTVVDHVRLFRNDPLLRWKYRVHEQILPAVRAQGGEVRWADVVIRHVGYQDPALRHRKLERDLGLLRREVADQPDDPFTLFNLGSVYQELGRTAEALPILQRSLALSHPTDSIVRKLYALIVACHRRLRQPKEALSACRAGRGIYPDDVELLFQEGLVLRELGDPAGAEACLLRLLKGSEGQHFASLDPGLSGYKARHNLAVVYHEQGRAAEAEAQWQAALAAQPDFSPALIGLGELYLGQGRWDELEPIAMRLHSCPATAIDSDLLRARAHLKRREFPAARELLEGAIARAPQALMPRVLLSHALLQEGRDRTAAERALRDVLALDPLNAEARHNLAVLLSS
jgi:tetratricopeptide (TPR) repeat protein